MDALQIVLGIALGLLGTILKVAIIGGVILGVLYLVTGGGRSLPGGPRSLPRL